MCLKDQLDRNQFLKLQATYTYECLVLLYILVVQLFNLA